MIFMRISLPNFVQFKAYQANLDHGVLYVNLFDARLSVFTTVNINSLNTNTVTK